MMESREEESRKRDEIPLDEYAEYGSPTECCRCDDRPYYRVRDFSTPGVPALRWMSRRCMHRWMDEMRLSPGSQYPMTAKPVHELEG